ncbi:shikimate kinase [Aquimarina sp. AD10]|uniref:Shikimate kinase n=1 Tax=Aquimarina aggregata TaxID=1642818 RepID=A0A162X6B5_9FLAO|nr:MULTISPECIES: shikimate kinase [Aquimarina]AXT60495.1 shikimate kinase [Aquimarina sp. AD10]KZS38442.1 shikimate kinase [Aquimarina aggregata]RKM96980.1 shikimate kinase [Aquimarina sp. AD10]
MNIVLMGYMGSGKSLIGNKLADKMKLEYLDLDDYIENQEKNTISKIFEEKGEIYFRKQESRYLKEVLEKQNNSVISLGGGTPCFAGNLEIIKESEKAKSIYLKTSLDQLTKRLFAERDKRPLISHLSTVDLLNDFIRKHLFERSFYYNQADHNIITDDREPDQISEEIITLLF